MALTEDQEPEAAEETADEAAEETAEGAAEEAVEGAAEETAQESAAAGDVEQQTAAGDDPFLPPPPPPRPTFVAELPTTPLAEGRYAYHNGDYAAAIEQLQAVVDSEEYDEESRISAAYWRAEALARQDLSPACIDHFQAVYTKYARSHAAGHHLASAALRRADALRVHFDIVGDVEAE
jgi:tetratricopeptide (TPR) repeat protein